MRLSTLAGVAALTAMLAATPALADDAAGTTLLHLSATSSVDVTPDQLVADLVATSTAPSAAAAQRKVNALIADGTATAQGVKGIDIRAVGYTVTPAAESLFSGSNGTPHKPTGWTAQQTLELRGTDGPALLDLVGKLQDKGFVTSGLDWQLSTKLMRQSHDQASDAALKDLGARAKAAADALGLHVAYAKDIRLDTPIFQPRAVMMTAMKVAAGPAATAAPQDATATVSGDYVLKP